MSDIRKDLILFDGVCNLCESSVRFVIKRDQGARFQFTSLQSDTSEKILLEHDYAGSSLASVLLLSQGSLYAKSRAALRIARNLDGAWPMFYYLFFWVPPVIADWIYDFIGGHRYQWFGMKDECLVPDPALRDRFIDS